MGDKIVIVDMQLLYGKLWQIDLKNETTGEVMRAFVGADELEKRMEREIARSKAKAEREGVQDG